MAQCALVLRSASLLRASDPMCLRAVRTRTIDLLASASLTACMKSTATHYGEMPPDADRWQQLTGSGKCDECARVH